MSYGGSFGMGGSSVPGVIQTGGGSGEWGLWIFALVLIFFCLAFWGNKDGRRGDGGMGGVGELAAVMAASNLQGGGNLNEINSRFNNIDRRFDNLNEMNELREIRTKQCCISDAILENRYCTERGFKDAQLQGERDTRAIIDNQNLIARDQEREAARRREDSLKEIIADLRYRCNDSDRRNELKYEGDHIIEELRRRPRYLVPEYVAS